MAARLCTGLHVVRTGAMAAGGVSATRGSSLRSCIRLGPVPARSSPMASERPLPRSIALPAPVGCGSRALSGASSDREGGFPSARLGAHGSRGRADFSLSAKQPKGAQDGWTLESTGEEVPEDHRPDLNVVLVHPEIPGNTGSIARSCAATRVDLHLIRPLGYEIDDTKLKRAGLDYWAHVVVKVHDDFDAFRRHFEAVEGEKRMVAFSARATVSYCRPAAFRPGDWLLFGAETTGLPPEVVALCKEEDPEGGLVQIPIYTDHVRSLNLAVACGIGMFEALRQLDGGPAGGRMAGEGAEVSA